MRENYTFSQVPKAEIPRSSFNRSHGHKTTFDGGMLIPIFVDEALPGDTFNVKATLFARLATPIVPIMDNMHMDVFYFAVPNRLLWENWQKFCGEQASPGDSTDYMIPQIQAPTIDGATGGFQQLSIFDYFGIPTHVGELSVNALFARAYNLIYNEWFRDENLCSPALVNKGDGGDTVDDFPLRRRGKRHDYFTSCLPWPQKGPGVELPVGGFANVAITGVGGPPTFESGFTTQYGPLRNMAEATGVNPQVEFGNASGALSAQDLRWRDPQLSGIADLSTSTAVTINALRQAFQIQKLLERDARGGTRYVEILKSHFGVVSPDFRLQRPEFLGGGSTPVVINPVSQTSETGTKTPQGNLAGYGTVAGPGSGFTKSFVEHSIVMGLVMVRADLSYQQGLPRMFSRKSRFDFYWPAFSHLGEQPVYNKEIYAQGPSVTDGAVPAKIIDDMVFGYQERWAEYRYFPSKITGKFRSTDPQPLDFWHLAQNFTALPVLGEEFIQERPPIDRIVAVTTEPQFIFDSHFSIKCTRPMPTYSVPGFIDHF